MKKTLAILLALLLVLVNVAALAEDENPTYKPTTGTTTFNITKLYEGDADTVVFPKETLAFVSTPADGNPTTENITVGTNNTYAVTSNAATGSEITVTLPSYSQPGVYYYTVTETAGTTQGVTYTDAKIEVGVVVVFDEKDAAQLVVSQMYGVIKNKDGQKDDKLSNSYSVGDLKVKKTVSGNLADKAKYFTFTVTFASKGEVLSDITYSGGKYTAAQTVAGNGWKSNTVVLELKADDEITFQNIPDGVTYEVKETSIPEADRIKNPSDQPNNTNAYVVTGETTGATAIDGDATTAASVTINNEKSITIDTGVNMETVPYIMLLAVAMIGIAVLKLRKREEY